MHAGGPAGRAPAASVRAFNLIVRRLIAGRTVQRFNRSAAPAAGRYRFDGRGGSDGPTAAARRRSSMWPVRPRSTPARRPRLPMRHGDRSGSPAASAATAAGPGWSNPHCSGRLPQGRQAAAGPCADRTGPARGRGRIGQARRARSPLPQAACPLGTSDFRGCLRSVPPSAHHGPAAAAVQSSEGGVARTSSTRRGRCRRSSLPLRVRGR